MNTARTRQSYDLQGIAEFVIVKCLSLLMGPESAAIGSKLWMCSYTNW